MAQNKAQETKMAFFERYAPIAMDQQQKYGIPASVTLAQMYIESGGGTSRLAVEGNNYFGIKCSKDWLAAGKPYSLHDDDRPNEKFCNYPSVGESVQHHSQFLMGDRYAGCRRCASDDYRGWANGLKAAGYATDANYASKLIRDIEAYGLQRYDQQALADARAKGLAIGYGKGQSPTLSAPLASSSSMAVPKGFYAMPLGHPMVLTSGFGVRQAPISGASTYHTGIDLAARYEDVRSTEHGTVVAVKNDMTDHDSAAVRKQVGNKGGNFVIVRYDRANGQSYYVSYCHLDENGVFVKKGDTVEAGQVIARSGSTGNGTGPHLHITVRHGVTGDSANGKRIDPLSYLAEVSVRGNLQESVKRNGSSENLLASHKADADTAPTLADLLAQQQAEGVVLTDEQLRNAEQGASLAALAGTSSPLSWLSLLLGQNGGNLGTAGHSDGLIGGLVSTLFMSAITLAMQLDSLGVSRDRVTSLQEAPESELRRAETLVRRERESVNPSLARDRASANFDAEYPEQQSQGAGQRLA